MKKNLALMSLLIVALLLLCVASVGAETTPDVTIKLLTPPPKNRPLELAVGQSYTFDILIKSDEPFVLAMAMIDAYYPGRGVFSAVSDRASQATSALLHLTITAKEPTDFLPAICDWPQPGDCWPEGVAPLSIQAGVRFPGGLIAADQFPFSVVVP